MSIAVLKRKTNAKYKQVSGNQRTNRFVDNKNTCGKCDHSYIGDGSIFSINGQYRTTTPIRQDYKVSTGGTKYTTVYDNNNRYVVPVGHGGTYGRYPKIVSFNLKHTCADNSNTIKPSTLDNKLIIDRHSTHHNKYKKYPNKQQNKWIVSNDTKDYTDGYNARIKNKETHLSKYTTDSKSKKYVKEEQVIMHGSYSRRYTDAYLQRHKDHQTILSKNDKCKKDCE